MINSSESHAGCLRAMIEPAKGSAKDCAISAAKDARVVKTMVLEQIPASRPRESTRGTSRERTVRQEESFRCRLAGNHHVDHRPRRKDGIQGLKLIERGITGQIMALIIKLYQREMVEGPACPLGPVGGRKDNIAVQPGDIPDIV